MKKYELTTNTKMRFRRKLFQIKALVSFGDVTAGDLGGYIEKEENLSHNGDAWISGDAQVYGDARVSGNAQVCGNAQVYGNARVCDDALVCGDARVSGDAWVYGDALVCGDAQVCGNAQVYGNAWVYGDARVSGDAWVSGDALVCGDAQVYGDALVYGNADYICLKGFGSKNRSTTMFRTKSGDVYVCCGCFKGSLKEFSEKVKETHGSSKYAKEYLACVEAAKIHFKIGEENDK